MIKESDLKPLFTSEMIQTEIKKLAAKLNDLYRGEEVYVISVLRGSVMFTVDLVKELKMPIKMEFIRLSSYGSSTSSSGNVEAVDITLPDLNNKNVLITEDIIDTGYTAKYLIDYLNKKYKTKSLKFCTLLNKKARRAVDIDADYYCFDVEDKYLIGYGMDYDGLFRNIPYVGYIET